MTKHLRHLSRLLLQLTILTLAACAPARGADLAQERSVKAAFLAKFIGFVEFAESSGPPASSPITIGVIGADDIAAELKRIAPGHAQNQRPVIVRALNAADSLAGVQLLFIGGDRTDRAVQVLGSAAKLGILTVTESDSGLQQGSTINFRRVDERVRFEVSMPAAQRSNVKLSARLLAVAYHVQKDPWER